MLEEKKCYYINTFQWNRKFSSLTFSDGFQQFTSTINFNWGENFLLHFPGFAQYSLRLWIWRVMITLLNTVNFINMCKTSLHIRFYVSVWQKKFEFCISDCPELKPGTRDGKRRWLPSPHVHHEWETILNIMWQWCILSGGTYTAGKKEIFRYHINNIPILENSSVQWVC